MPGQMKAHQYTHGKTALVLIDIRLIPIYPHGENGTIWNVCPKMAYNGRAYDPLGI